MFAILLSDKMLNLIIKLINIDEFYQDNFTGIYCISLPLSVCKKLKLKFKIRSGILPNFKYKNEKSDYLVSCYYSRINECILSTNIYYINENYYSGVGNLMFIIN